MAQFTSMLNVRVRPGHLEALDWYARRAGVPQATAARYFLPSRVPDDQEHDLADVADTVEGLRRFAEVELEDEIDRAEASRLRNRGGADA